MQGEHAATRAGCAGWESLPVPGLKHSPALRGAEACATTTLPAGSLLSEFLGGPLCAILSEVLGKAALEKPERKAVGGTRKRGHCLDASVGTVPLGSATGDASPHSDGLVVADLARLREAHVKQVVSLAKERSNPSTGRGVSVVAPGDSLKWLLECGLRAWLATVALPGEVNLESVGDYLREEASWHVLLPWGNGG